MKGGGMGMRNNWEMETKKMKKGRAKDENESEKIEQLEGTG